VLQPRSLRKPQSRPRLSLPASAGTRAAIAVLAAVGVAGTAAAPLQLLLQSAGRRGGRSG
jgi:hypothetical protein